MPKQSRVTLAKLDESIGLLVMALDRNQRESDARIKTLEGALTLYVDTEIKQLNSRMSSDFQDQDDEIEKISRRLQSVEDKLKAKQLGEETNVTLTARVKELQRQLTDAKNQIERMEAQILQTSHLIATERNEWQRSVENVRKERDEQSDRADRVQRELNEAGITISELQLKLASAERIATEAKQRRWAWWEST